MHAVDALRRTDPDNDSASDTEQPQQGRFAASGLNALLLRGGRVSLWVFSRGHDLRLCSMY